MNRKKAIVVGSGSYVLGDSFGDGVIYPSLLYLQKKGLLDRITFAVRSERDEAFSNKLEQFAKKIGHDEKPEVFIYKELDELTALDLEQSIMFLSVPDFDHYEITKFFLTKKCPCWVVKPLTGTYEESKGLDELARSMGVPLWVDYHKRFDQSKHQNTA